MNHSSFAYRGLVRSATLSSLRSGHSHEDIDQHFGRLAKYIVKWGGFVETPQDFRDVIQKWLSEGNFPFEPGACRKCVLVDQTRDWRLDLKLQRNE